MPSYCKCGNAGQEGEVCTDCHGEFAFQQRPKSLRLIMYVAGGAFCGLLVGGGLASVMGILGWITVVVGVCVGVSLGGRLYNRVPADKKPGNQLRN